MSAHGTFCGCDECRGRKESKVEEAPKIRAADEDVNLTSQELAAASEVLIEFLKAWEHSMWGMMGRLLHVPASLEASKIRTCKAQFGASPLLTFEEDINITKAMGDWHVNLGTKKRERIAYIDFGVVVVCGNEKLITRTGVFIRMVLINDKWLINPHSMNRRFDPKLADAVREEAEQSEAQEQVESDKEAGSNG